MMTAVKSKKTWISVLCVFLASVLMLTWVYSTKSIAADDEPEDASFYKIASSASAHLNDRLAHNEGVVFPASGGSVGTDGKVSAAIDFGSAGGLLGYCDEADADGLIMGGINPALSSSSATFSYSSMKNLPVSGGGQSSALYMYCRYGYLLTALGLDSTSAEVSFDFFRFLSGLLMTVAYVMAFTVDLIFAAIVAILSSLNPFKFFRNGMSATWQKYVAAMPTDSPLQGLAGFLSGLYSTLSNLSWTVVIPMSCVILIFSLLVLKSANRGSKIKKFIIRIVFVAAGIPLLGSLYTTSLEALGDPSNGGMGAATRIVQSTFCDFENWAKNCRLGLSGKGGTAFVWTSNDGSDGGSAHPYSEAMLRNICYSINKEAHGEGASFSDWASGGMDVGKGFDITTGDNSTTSDILETLGMLGRYMNGSFFYASDWETLVKAQLTTKSSVDENYYKEVMDVLSKSDSPNDFKDTNHFDGSSGWGSADLWNNGSFSAAPVSVATDEGTEAQSVKFSCNSTAPGTRGNTEVGADPSTKYGLSTMAMYNYLTSKFTPTSVVVYSNEKASSGFVRESHRSVNMVGTGVVQIMYFFNAFIMLLAMTVVGWCYGFGLVFSNIKRSIRMITSVPFAMLGSIRGIAKAVVYALVMIIEIIGTLFVYSLLTELLIGISSVVEQPIMHALSNSALGTGNATTVTALMYTPIGAAITIIALLVSSIVLILFIVMAFRLRKVIIKSLDESAAAIVNKFMEVDEVYSGVNDPKKQGLISKAAGAVGQGAGMAVGGKLAQGGMRAMGAGASGQGTAKAGSSSAEGAGSASNAGSNSSAGSMDSDKAAAAAMALSGGSGGSAGTPALSDGGGSMEEGAGFGGVGDTDAADKQMAAPMLGLPDTSAPANEMAEAADAADEKTENMVDSMTAKTDAMEEMADDEARNEIAKAERKEGMQKVSEGTVDTAIGAAKLAAAASAGDVKTGVEGAQQLKKGTDNMSSGGKQASKAGQTADREVTRERNAENATKGPSVGESAAPPPRQGKDGKSGSNGSNGNGSNKTDVHNNTQSNQTNNNSNSSNSQTTQQGAVQSQQQAPPPRQSNKQSGKLVKSGSSGTGSGGKSQAPKGKSSGGSSSSPRVVRSDTSNTSHNVSHGGSSVDNSRTNVNSKTSNRNENTNRRQYNSGKNGARPDGSRPTGNGRGQNRRQNQQRSVRPESGGQRHSSQDQNRGVRRQQKRNDTIARSEKMNQQRYGDAYESRQQTRRRMDYDDRREQTQWNVEQDASSRSQPAPKKLDTSGFDDDI